MSNTYFERSWKTWNFSIKGEHTVAAACITRVQSDSLSPERELCSHEVTMSLRTRNINMSFPFTFQEFKTVATLSSIIRCRFDKSLRKYKNVVAFFVNCNCWHSIGMIKHYGFEYYYDIMIPEIFKIYSTLKVFHIQI